MKVIIALYREPIKIECSSHTANSIMEDPGFTDPMHGDFSLKDGAEGQKIFSQFIPPLATGFGINSSAFHVTYKYTFGGDIISDNSTTHDGRVLIWEYSLAAIGSGKTISVTFRPFRLKETPPWIYALSGLVLLIVIIFLFKKKRD